MDGDDDEIHAMIGDDANPDGVPDLPEDENHGGEGIFSDSSDEEMQIMVSDDESQNEDADDGMQNQDSSDEENIHVDDDMENVGSDQEVQMDDSDLDDVSIANTDSSVGDLEDEDNIEINENNVVETFTLDMEGDLRVRLMTAAHGNIVAWEQFLLVIAKTLRFKESYVSMLSTFRILNQGFANGPFPRNMKKFWQLVNRREDHFSYTVVCTICWALIGDGKVPTQDCNCHPVQCGPNRNNDQMGTFFYVNLEAQIEALLRRENIAQDLLYPYTRTKLNDEAIEDVYDGTVYRHHSAEGQFLHRNNHNYSLAMWVDGVSPVKSSNVQIVPVFFQVLELSPRARQRNSILAALYVGPRKPLMATFLTPVTITLHNLRHRGVNWQPNINEERRSRFMLLIVSADSEERYTIFGMTRHNGRFGCTCCLVNGVRNREAANRTRIYPVENEGNVRERTDLSIRRDSRRADRLGVSQNGVKNISALYPLEVDLRTAQLMEPLHLFWKGNSVRLHNNCTKPNRPNHILPRNLATISSRIKAIRPPTKLSRLPRDLTNFAKFTGNEQRNNAWFYWLPCAQDFLTRDQLRLFSRFAEATYILSKGSILPNELNRASLLLDEYRRLFQDQFPREEWVYNVHLIKHAARSVRELGPSFVASGFWFESLNRQVVNYLTSPNDRASQVANRMLLAQMVEKFLDAPLTLETLTSLWQFTGKGRWVQQPEAAAGTYVRLHGNGTEAAVSIPQLAALAEAGFRDIDHGLRITKFKKIDVSGVFYQVPRERGRQPKYNNSIASINTEYRGVMINFIAINAIVNWQRGEEEMTGIFGTPFNTIELAFETTYMHIVEKSDDLMYVAATDIKNAAVLVESCGRVYISPLPSRWEND